MSSPLLKSYQTGLAAILMMSTVPIVIKYISADPWVIGLGRLILATAALSMFTSAVREFRNLVLKDWLILAGLGLCFGLHWITYFFSIKLGLATVAVISTVSFYGIFLSIAGNIFLAHRVRWFHALALLLSVLGTVLVAGQFDLNSNALIGFVLGIVSGGLYGLLPILHQKSTHMKNSLRSWGQFSGAMVMFAFCAPLGNWDVPATDWLGIVYLGLIGTFGAHSLWVNATSVLPTTASSLIMYLYIPLSAILGYFVLGETLNFQQVMGALLIIAGSMLGMLGDRFLKKMT